MESTKDLVRAERGSRFVCQVGGTPAAPRPQQPLQLLDPAPRPASPSHAPSTSGAPLPLPAVKRFRGFPSPPPPQPRTLRGSLYPLYTLSERKNLEESFPLSRPLPLQLWLGGVRLRLRLRLSLFRPPRVGEESSCAPGGHSWGALLGWAPLPFGATAARHFARGGGNIERGRGGHVWEGEVGVVFGKQPPGLL